ncbi:MAG: helix-turn-helix transcriptional regulator [Treponema sp.]|nr:helix-turn-helix transcriptional regulator [Treponema sp.]
MTNIRTVLSYNMKTRRKALGLSQIDLAEKTGSAANYISKIEAERQFPSVEMIEKLAEALQIDTVDLFSLANQKKSRILQEKSLLIERISNEIDSFLSFSQ